MSTHHGHPVRLADGSWGVKVEGNSAVAIGDSVDVTDRSGQTWTVEVAEIIDRDAWGTRVRKATHRRESEPGNE